MSKVSNLMYRLMVLTYNIQDLFSKPGDVLLHFEIKNGDTVVDYGCGPGRYIKKASELVGENGKVYAADIHDIAIRNVIKSIKHHKLKNVIPVQLTTDTGAIPESSADVVYALDMFHQVKEPAEFLLSIHRIIKSDGFLYLEDGHQSRKTALDKVSQSALWCVESQNDKYIQLSPLKSKE